MMIDMTLLPSSNSSDLKYRSYGEGLFRQSLTLFILSFLAWCSAGGRGVFHLHPITPLSLQSDGSNFVQNYFGVGQMFCGKKNRDQIDIDITMTSSLL